MTRLLGLDALWVALAVAAVGGILIPVAVRRGRHDLLGASYAAVYTHFALLTVATAAMVYGLVTHDFSISYVAQVGSRATPTFYTVISLWGALEGSILFWGWVLSMYSAAVIWFNRERPGLMVPYAASALLVISLFFGILLVGPANPFGLVNPAPADGPGPNPLLQNHWLMGIHPPLLYLGYVGMSVPFAFALGAMLSGEVDKDDWMKVTRKWTISAWMFLTAAIIAGMWWSYEVLGWGGYWAWDPVENASFMPWLTATAFLHSQMVQERRGMLKLWNVNLIVGTFVLTILGTFLTRSGVLSSVHAFTTGTIGYYFLGFIGVVLLASFALVAGNSDRLASTGRLDAALSRETVFLLNNLFLTAFMLTVLIGTLFPLVAEAIRGVKVSVGEPFFNKMSLPLCAALIFLMGVGPALPWKRADADVVRRKLVVPVGIGVLFALAAAGFGARHPYAILAFLFAGFAIACNVHEYVIGARARMKAHGENALVATARLVDGNPRRYGGYLAHLGVLITTLGIAASATFRFEHEATLKPGDTMQAAPFTLRLEQVWGREEPQRSVIGATMVVMRDGKEVGRLQPRMNFYPTSDQPVPTPDVRSRPSGDLYLNLMAFRPDGSNATVKAIVEPLVPWIWFGGGVMCLGAIVAWAPFRRRGEARAVARAVSTPAGGPPPVPAGAMSEAAS